MSNTYQQAAFAYQPTFQGEATSPALTPSNVAEPINIFATAATGTINYDVGAQSILYFNADASANWTLNLRGGPGIKLDTLMRVNQALTIVHMVQQGATAYYNSALQVDSIAVTPKWQGGTAPAAGNASSIDVYTYTVIKTGSGVFTVLASQTQFK